MHKRCNECLQTKPLDKDNFARYSNKRNGSIKVGFRNICKICMNNRVANHDRENPEMVKERQKKRKKLFELAGNLPTKIELRKIRVSLSDKCNYCGNNLFGGGDLDHKIPLSKGGTNDFQNLTYACRQCNADKHNKTANEFINWRKAWGYKIRDNLV